MSIERLKALIDLFLALNSERFLEAGTLSERVPHMSKSSLYHTLEKWIAKRIVIKKERTETPAGVARADYKLSDKGKEILNSIIIKFPNEIKKKTVSLNRKEEGKFDLEKIENLILEISDDLEHLLSQDAMKEFQLILEKKLRKLLL